MIEIKQVMAKTKKFLKRVLLLSAVLLIVLGVFQYFRPLPILQPVSTLKTPAVESSAVSLPWPNYGQSALGASGFGVLETHGIQSSVPIASIAKVMTAVSVLKERPLSAGQQGALITISGSDVAVYNDYYSKGGSVAKVVAGEQISEYQALQAMLLPSANNFADTLAVWAFGSLDKYIEYANDLAKAMELKDTHIADASGFSPQTMSSAHDLVILGEALLKDPVLAGIVNQQEATVPEAGLIMNTNRLIGSDGISGVKTGNTEQAGGCYLFSSKRNVAGQDITVVGAILGAPQLSNAMVDSVPLLNASNKGFKAVTAVKAGQVVGYYQLPWGNKVSAVAKNSLTMLSWQNQKIQVSTILNPTRSKLEKGTSVGSITAAFNKKPEVTPAVLAQKMPAPSWRWRIFNR
jgi:D-alanyl-D-alanine carboxypeptidase (penicillin-binding protein 5/6)